MGLTEMSEYDFSKELKRFKEINKYSKKMIAEQEAPIPPPEGAEAGALPGEEEAGAPPADAEEFAPPTGDTENAEVSTDTAGEDDATEELDVTDLVNMTKSIKKQLDDQPKEDTGVMQKMDDVFNKLNDLESKLGEMDSIISKIDALGSEIEKVRPKTPVEKLEMRSLDSYPFDKSPTDFFSEKQQQMKDAGKNEYVLTKSDVENYGKNEIMKSFNPKAMENDYNF